VLVFSFFFARELLVAAGLVGTGGAEFSAAGSYELMKPASKAPQAPLGRGECWWESV